MFFNQSALLYANYYYVQIMIHRPFISSCRKPSVLSFPSLAICTNAARSCCHVMDTQRRHEPLALPHVQVGFIMSLDSDNGLIDNAVGCVHIWGCTSVTRVGWAKSWFDFEQK
jgi:hypothetical protein